MSFKLVIAGLVLFSVLRGYYGKEFQDWLIIGLPDPEYSLTVTFAIKQTNTQWLAEKIRAVSYPNSPEYGNYMNFDEIANHVHGRPESVKALLSSLQSVGISLSSIDFTLGRDFAVVQIPVKIAEKLFSTVFYEYENQECGDKIITSESPTLPPSLEGHLDFVSGIKSFPSCAKPKTIRTLNLTQSFVTPDTIATDYNTSKYMSTNEKNSQSIAAFLKQYYDPTDLAKFQRKYHLPEKEIFKVVGKNIPDDPGAEANLDVQYIGATGRGVDTWFVSVSTYSNGQQEDFLSWIVSQVNTTDSPWVHSASYGDVEHTIDLDYLSRVDNEFMKFGISGRTILFASGDSGVSCRVKGRKKTFSPNWPASSPYVTAVGGTESTTRVWTSGGSGFSDVFGMPDYQADVVKAYVANLSDTSKFNTSGRAYPDVSAFATNFIIFDDGVTVPVDGTSCSTPTFAGIISSLNDIRLNNGEKTLGFLNPLLYQNLMGKGFIDITEGQNGDFLCEGFKAGPGWDAASGWGSPNFGLLKDMV